MSESKQLSQYMYYWYMYCTGNIFSKIAPVKKIIRKHVNLNYLGTFLPSQSSCRVTRLIKIIPGRQKKTNEAVSSRTKRSAPAADDAVVADSRTTDTRPTPVNKLSVSEQEQIPTVANGEEFASLPPGQIVPMLADRSVYLASESSFYRIMKQTSQQHHRCRAQKPSSRVVTSHSASGQNEGWSWDITWLPAAVIDRYYYWYLMLDVFSRKIVGHEVHEAEAAELASLLMRRTSLSEELAGLSLVLGPDNGRPMKGATMLATLENPGVNASFNRPRVGNDNPYAESLFRAANTGRNIRTNRSAVWKKPRHGCTNLYVGKTRITSTAG